jgi:hypothetical protein
MITRHDIFTLYVIRTATESAPTCKFHARHTNIFTNNKDRYISDKDCHVVLGKGSVLSISTYILKIWDKFKQGGSLVLRSDIVLRARKTQPTPQ